MCQKDQLNHHSKRKRRSAEKVTSADFDLLTTAAFFAAFSLNRQALIPLAGMLITYLIKPHLFDYPIALLLSYSVVYATLSISYIRIKSEIRYAMITHALLYWLLAVDYYCFDSATLYTECFKPMIRLLDLYILYQLLNTGGRQNVGLFTTSGYRWFYRL